MTTNNPAAQPAEFKVGDRVRNKHASWPDATVVEITKRGFRYEYDKPFLISPRLGSTTGGEAYRESFESWEVVSMAQPAGVEGAPGKVYIQFRPKAETLAEQLLDGGIWRYEGGPDCIEYTRTPPTDISERARRVQLALCEAGLIDHGDAGTDGEQELLHQRIAAIITAEFGGGQGGENSS